MYQPNRIPSTAPTAIGDTLVRLGLLDAGQPGIDYFVRAIVDLLAATRCSIDDVAAKLDDLRLGDAGSPDVRVAARLFAGGAK